MSTDGLSDYEKMRLEKIARNESYLVSLGLGGSASASSKRKRVSRPDAEDDDENAALSPRSSSSARRRGPLPQSSIDESLLRRSGRAKGGPVDYTAERAYGALEVAERRISSSGGGGGDKQSSSSSSSSSSSKSTLRLIYKAVPSISLSSDISPLLSSSSSSSSSSSAIVRKSKDLLVNIPSVVSSMLGKAMSSCNKAPVVSYCAGTQSPVSFNKYCGVCDYKNCDILFVNFSNTNEYKNEFLEGGRKITWFGGSKMRGDCPSVLRLASLGSNSTCPSVLLWCRFAEGSNTGPYVFLGRLKYESHDKESYPVKFVWRLHDFDALNEGRSSTNNKDKKEENNFHTFVNF